MFNKVIVSVIGSSESGKTTAVEALIKGLTKQGYMVASAKHIPEKEFTIDTEGKDTWRHAKAGASTVLSVAPNELSTIKKVDTTKYSLEQIVAEFPDEVDIIILEGFKALVGQDMTIPKIDACEELNAPEHLSSDVLVGALYVHNGKDTDDSGDWVNASWSGWNYNQGLKNILVPEFSTVIIPLAVPAVILSIGLLRRRKALF